MKFYKDGHIFDTDKAELLFSHTLKFGVNMGGGFLHSDYYMTNNVRFFVIERREYEDEILGKQIGKIVSITEVAQKAYDNEEFDALKKLEEIMEEG